MNAGSDIRILYQGCINPREGKRACNVYSKIKNATKNSNNCKPKHCYPL